MNKLLSAGFMRLKKDTFFRIAMVFMFAIGILQQVCIYIEMKKYEYTIPLENAFFTYAFYMAVLSSVFCSLFIGTEYSEGTIRNKLIAGHKRRDIYLSNLTVCTAAVFLICLSYLAAALCAGIPLLGFFTADLNTVLEHGGCIFVLSISFTAILTAAAMLCQRRSITAVICILGVFALLFLGFFLDAQLDTPENFAEYIYLEDNGELVTIPAEPNPYYIGGVRRDIYELIQDWLPGGQTAQLSSLAIESSHRRRLALYSCLFSIASTGLGICLFVREDIK